MVPDELSSEAFSEMMRISFLTCCHGRRRKGFAVLVFLCAIFIVSLLFLQNRNVELSPVGDNFWLDLFHSKYFIPRSNIITPLQISYVIQPEGSCNKEAYFVVLVLSHPRDGLTRMAIRNTWGKALKKNQWPNAQFRVQGDVFYLLGRPSSQLEHESVEREAHENDDVIMGDFDDTYRNLSRKMMFGLNWISKNCGKTKFFVKIDRDTFVDFPRLMGLLKMNERELQNSVVGKLYYSPWVLNSGKWKNDPKEYPFSMFPTFAGGPCYIMSTDLTARIVNVSQYMPFLSLEDVYITGVLSKSLGAHKHTIHQLHNFPEEETFCDFVAEEKTLLSTTQLSTENLRNLWQVITTRTC